LTIDFYLCPMKRWLYISICAITCVAFVSAQTRRSGGNAGRGGFSLSSRNAMQLPDSLLAAADTTSAAPITAYQLSALGDRAVAPMDTDRLNTANSTLPDGYRFVAYTGNVGSPSQSRIFSERPESRDFIFADPYNALIINSSNALFYDTKIPYTNVLYTRAGSSDRMEEQLKITLTSNFGKKINAGGDFDYIYARGFYNSNGNKIMNYRLFGSYRSDHYEAYAHVRNLNIVNSENGGLSNTRYVTHPDDFADGKRKVDSRSFPTRFTNTWNRVRGKDFFLAHRYNLGFYRPLTSREAEKQQPQEAGNNTSADEVFVPVSSIIHTFEYEDNSRRFISEAYSIDTCYQNIYGDSLQLPNDTVSTWRMRNTLALSLREGFQDWAKFGLSVFASIENRRFKYMGDSIIGAASENEFSTFIGGEISKQHGTVFTYNAFGELCIAGKDLGEFRIRGDARTSFKLLNENASLEINGYIRNVRPAFFQQHYYGRYYQWDRPFKMTQHLHVEGAASIQRTRTRLSVGIESVQNYTYFGADGLPAQFGGNIRVLTARLRQDFRYRALGWENEIIYQEGSEGDVLPLPKLCAYTNLYAAFRMFDVLTVQLGADMHYFTSYHSPYYEPATQQFINQDKVTTGNYPMVNAYANFHLKQARFFVMAYNLSSLAIDHPEYFSMPNYPLNPMYVKMGVAVMFNN